jgi:hypothetical protein
MMGTMLNFAQEMARMAYVVKANIPKVQKRAALAVVEQVARSTPVLTGQAAGNWMTTVGTPSSAFIPGAAGAAASIARVGPALEALGVDQKVCIANNAPYIEKLNNGSSQQAPSLFVEAATLRAIQGLDRYNILVS